MSATVKRIVLRTPPAVGATAQFSALERCRAYAEQTADSSATAQHSAATAQASSAVATAARDAALAAVGAVKASPTDASPSTLDQALAVAAPLAKQVTGQGGDECLTLSVAAMAGATASGAGLPGLVPAPLAGEQGRFLRGDATWQALDRSSLGLASVEDTWTALAGPLTVLAPARAAIPGDQTVLAMPGGVAGRAVKPDAPAGASGFIETAVYDGQNDRTLISVTGFSLDGQATSLTVGQDPRNAPESSSAGSDLYLAEAYACLGY